jgi:hypothetical protein
MLSNETKMCQRVCVGVRWSKFEVIAISLFAINLLLFSDQAMAYERYKNDLKQPGSNCSACHGDFDGPVSTKGTIFPDNDKHEMHRTWQDGMFTACDLCHTSGDGRNAYIGSSDGTTSTPGLGCSGCHGRDYGGTTGVIGAGLRAHHAINGVTTCANGSCHTADPVPLPENVPPPYYGSPYTLAYDSCNTAPDYLENWSIGDQLGLDNDGDNAYDECDVMDQDGDGILDDCDIDQNLGSIDLDGNGIIDSCECDWANIDGLNPVNFLDFALLAADWGITGAGLVGDANSDGTVDILDLSLVARFWLAVCN